VDRKTAADIDREIEKSRAELIKIRRFIHMNPQLPGREGETARLISGRLQALGLEVRSGVGKTGSWPSCAARSPGPWSLCAPIWTPTPSRNWPTSPINPQRRRNARFGHDLHTTIGLGTAMVLAALKERVRGGVKFIFQPGDENIPARTAAPPS